MLIYLYDLFNGWMFFGLILICDIFVCFVLFWMGEGSLPFIKFGLMSSASEETQEEIISVLLSQQEDSKGRQQRHKQGPARICQEH